MKLFFLRHPAARLCPLPGSPRALIDGYKSKDSEKKSLKICLVKVSRISPHGAATIKFGSPLQEPPKQTPQESLTRDIPPPLALQDLGRGATRERAPRSLAGRPARSPKKPSGPLRCCASSRQPAPELRLPHAFPLGCLL